MRKFISNWKSDLVENWRIFLCKKKNISSLILAFAFFSFITFLFTQYLPLIQRTIGLQLNDYLLRVIPARDVSEIVFVLLYSIVMLTYTFFIAYPQNLRSFLIFYALSLAVRFITMFLVPLEPPIDCIVIQDPILKMTTYNGVDVTRDLFFSGHMVTVLCCSFAIFANRIRTLFFASAFILSILLLVQHIHYTIDIVGAWIVVLLFYKIYYQKAHNNYIHTYSYKTINTEKYEPRKE